MGIYNMPECDCKADIKGVHKYNCPVSRWERLLYDDGWEGGWEGTYPYETSIIENDSEASISEIVNADEYVVGPWWADSPDPDCPLPPSSPDKWTDAQWKEVAAKLAVLPEDDRLFWEGEIKWEQEYDDAVIVETKEKVCNCNAEKFNNIHLKSCPMSAAYEDKSNTKPYSYVPLRTCKHNRDKPFELSPGLSIYLSAYRDVKYLDDESINVGVYLYDSWQGDFTMVSPGLDVPWQEKRLTKAVMLDWTDYKGFDNLKHLKDVIEWVIAEMHKGTTFEIGCMGGHGRTGTMAACLLIAADESVLPPDAIERIRTEHCDKAIESNAQVEMIADFYKLWHGNAAWRKNSAHRKRFDAYKRNITPITGKWESTTWKGGDKK